MEDHLIAHVHRKDDGTWAKPQSLADHLCGTADLAERHAAKFASGEWGKAAGIAHDAGKARPEWQAYLVRKSGYSEYDEEAHMEEKAGKIPHAIYGAILAEKLYGKGPGRLLAYCIAGHHAGLTDWSSDIAGKASLRFQESRCQNVDDIDGSIVELIKTVRPVKPPWAFSSGLDISLWIRMLYSSLVDADFLDTEEYMDQDKSRIRGDYQSMPDLLKRFNGYIRKMDDSAASTAINKIRREIRAKCVNMAKEKQGVYSLSVPTGGGKTLSTLAFGLEHAIKHSLERIIYVIPYTSIIEQNADVFKSALGADQVVEHHSNIDENASSYKARLAAENWDAPVIVTTTVQFFESLFAAKSSRCRKLHNIAKSVVIMDEAQLVPVEFLAPILETMQLLVEHYQVSFVLSTATQPAFRERISDGKPFRGLKRIEEIMGTEKDVTRLYESLNRCQVEFPDDFTCIKSWESLATELQEYSQVLCVVSDRKSCRELFSLMPQGTIHLSALMCSQHRSIVFTKIKEKLKNGETVRVISTQLVEAGVDLDFPVVYRSMAGLDSIAQAAGRCNREGKMSGPGKVVVFVPPRQPPVGILRKAAETTRNLVSIMDEPLQYDVFEQFFTELYWKAKSLDSKDIVRLLDPARNEKRECSINFRTAAQQFHIIDDSLSKTILIPYREGQGLIELLKSQGPERWLLRKLQRFTVNIYNDEFNQMMNRGSIVEIYPEMYILASDAEYSEEIGLLIESLFEPDKFII